MPLTFEDYQATVARIYFSRPAGGVAGAAFLVSPRYLVTCAHVVCQALQWYFLEKPQSQIYLDFPNNEINGQREASIELWNPCTEYLDDRRFTEAKLGDDLALLRLRQALPDDMSIIPLKVLSEVLDHPFHAFGFPDRSPAGQATSGTIRALLRASGWYQLQVNLDSPPIEPGFSGAPLWSREHAVIVGMTVAASLNSPNPSQSGMQAYAIAGTALWDIWYEQGQLIEAIESIDWDIVQNAYQDGRLLLQQNWPKNQPEDCASAIAELYRFEKIASKQQRLILFVYILKRFNSKFNNLSKELKDWPDKYKNETQKWQQERIGLVEQVEVLNRSLNTISQEYTEYKKQWQQEKNEFQEIIQALNFEIQMQEWHKRYEIGKQQWIKEKDEFTEQVELLSRKLSAIKQEHTEYREQWRQEKILKSKIQEQYKREKKEWLAKQSQSEKELAESRQSVQIKKQKSIYADLEVALQNNEFEVADQETHKILTDSVRGSMCNLHLPLEEHEIQELPLDVLRDIDNLWIDLSQRRFGFKVQLGIYLSSGIGERDRSFQFEKFCERLGWTSQHLTREIPDGHFPSYLHFAQEDDFVALDRNFIEYFLPRFALCI